MSKITVSRVIFVLFLAATILFVITGYQLVKDNVPSFTPIFIAWVISAVKMTYDSFSKVYLAFNKFVAWFLNIPSNWEFAIQYSLANESKQALYEATKAIINDTPQAKIWHDGETQKIIQAPGFTARIKISPQINMEEPDNIKSDIYINFTDMSVSYRYTQKILSNKIAPLLENINNALQFEFVKYTLRIRYEDKNPFFGLYIKKLPPNQVASFKCELFEIIGNEKDFVSIQKEATMINTSSISHLMALSQKYLSYSSTS